MYSRNHRKARILFALSDAFLTALAFETAYQARSLLPLEKVFFLDLRLKLLLLSAAACSAIFFGLWAQTYERLDAAKPLVSLRDSLKQVAFSSICLILFEYLLRLDLSRGFLLLFFATQLLFHLLFRWNAGSLVRLLRREFGASHFVLIFGSGDRAQSLAREISAGSAYGVRLTGIVDDPAEVLSRLHEHVVDEVLFAVEPQRLAELQDLFLRCDEEGVRTRISLDFFPQVNSEVYLDRLGDTPLLSFSATPHDEVKLLVKRSLDVLIASLSLLVLSPLLLLIALAVRLSSPGPVIFRQLRCGLNGRRFYVCKFRSMVANAEELKSSVAHLNVKQLNFKIPNDPRLTPLGGWLRKFSLDELPQFWNVLKGDMSLVGPRPALPDEVDRYQNWQRRRMRMRPGVTCIWAVQGRDELDTETVMRLDMQYIDNWSLGLDSQILLRSIPVVLLGKGAH